MITMIEENWGVGPWDCVPDKTETDNSQSDEPKSKSIGDRIIDWLKDVL